MSSAKHVVLVGMMGAGKTTVGRDVAARLSRPFVDTDDVVEARARRTVREIFEADGEPAFRELETEALVAALAEPEPLVIAAGGGVVVRAENRDALRRARAVVVWLSADAAVLAARVADADHRPLLDDDPQAALRRLHAERGRWYEGVAATVIDTTQLPADSVGQRVVDVVEASDGG